MHCYSKAMRKKIKFTRKHVSNSEAKLDGMPNLTAINFPPASSGSCKKVVHHANCKLCKESAVAVENYALTSGADRSRSGLPACSRPREKRLASESSERAGRPDTA